MVLVWRFGVAVSSPQSSDTQKAKSRRGASTESWFLKLIQQEMDDVFSAWLP
jgi:hypothetical protein